MPRCLSVTAACVLVLGSTTALRAQDRPSIDAAGGYSFSYITNDGGSSLPGGWFASVGGYITPTFAIVGEGTGAYKSEAFTFSNAGLTMNVETRERIYTYQVGPRFRSRSAASKVFGQFLVGAATLSSDAVMSGTGMSASGNGSETYFAFTPGGGVDVKASQHLALRFSANFQFIVPRQGGNWGKVFQTGVGLVWTSQSDSASSRISSAGTSDR